MDGKRKVYSIGNAAPEREQGKRAKADEETDLDVDAFLTEERRKSMSYQAPVAIQLTPVDKLRTEWRPEIVVEKRAVHSIVNQICAKISFPQMRLLRNLVILIQQLVEQGMEIDAIYEQVNKLTLQQPQIGEKQAPVPAAAAQLPQNQAPVPAAAQLPPPSASLPVDTNRIKLDFVKNCILDLDNFIRTSWRARAVRNKLRTSFDLELPGESKVTISIEKELVDEVLGKNNVELNKLSDLDKKVLRDLSFFYSSVFTIALSFCCTLQEVVTFYQQYNYTDFTFLRLICLIKFCPYSLLVNKQLNLGLEKELTLAVIANYTFTRFKVPKEYCLNLVKLFPKDTYFLLFLLRVSEIDYLDEPEIKNYIKFFGLSEIETVLNYEKLDKQVYWQKLLN